MSAADQPSLEQMNPRPWGEKGTAGPVFAGNVTFENVSYVVRGKTILQNISLELKAGKIACLLGPSGCGKTTLLRLAAGVARPTSGRILLDHLEVAGPNKFLPPEKRNIGLMFQDFALFPHMTALQNVAYGLYALKKSDADAVASLALERVGLAEVKNRYPAMLSGGEQQRVALARAIVPRPQVILMDEPFSGLDQRLRETVRAETLAVLRETRATCLLVTHDPLEALALADHIYLLRAGKLVQQGPPESLMQNPIDPAAARFFTQHNEFVGSVSNGNVETPLGLIAAPGIAEGETALVMIPPGAIEVLPAGQGHAGQLQETRFMGDHRHLRFSMGNNGPIVECLADVKQILPLGAVFGLAVSSARAHVFPQARSEA